MIKKILNFLIMASIYSSSGALRFDISMQDYESFALNNGKFKAGNKNILIYDVNGENTGIIEEMPNFDGVDNGGQFVYLDDPQLLGGVAHVGNRQLGYIFLERHIRKDVNLYNNYYEVFHKKNDHIKLKTEIEKFSETAKGIEYVKIGGDWALVRLDRVLHDATTYEMVKDYTKIKKDDLVARMGLGRVTVSNKNGSVSQHNARFTGGLNKLTRVEKKGVEEKVYINLFKEPLTAMDIGTNSGDSGSPLFWWDKDDKKWKYLANNSEGFGASNNLPWNVTSVLRTSSEKYEYFKNKTFSNIINDAYSVEFKNDKLIVDGKVTIFNKKILNNDDLNFYKLKNQIFNVPNLIIQVLSKTDTNEARLEFMENTKIDGIADLKTAGYVVASGKTLTYKLKINEGNIVRKIGKGTLVVNSIGNNEGDINIGEGTLVLSNSGGYAAKNIRLAKGAIVKINSSDQLNKNNIYFGLRGGKLDLNGNDLKFEDIYHLDSDAEINNSSKSKSNFTFSPTGIQDRTYLGSFKGNLDLFYTPIDNITWELRGNTEINGSLNVNKGKLKIIGDNVIVGANNNILEDEYIKSTFKSKNINVKTTLEIGRAVEIDSNINLENNAILNINLNGIVKDKMGKIDFVDGKTEKEINTTKILGNINFNTNNSLNINVENNNSLEIGANLNGNANIVKTGIGVAEINSSNNSLEGNITINEGRLRVNDSTTLGNTVSLIKENAFLEVDNNVDFSNLLNKIDENSSGVLSIGENLPILDKKYMNYPKLYLGTSKNIIIGSDDIMISDEIKNINLGGDSGNIILKGLHLSKDVKTINIESGAKVTIDKVLDDNNFKFVVKNGTLNIKEILTNNKMIDLQYGNFYDYSNKNLILENSEGVLELKNEKNIETNMFIGAKENTNVEINSIITSGDYKFSGRGNLIITSKLESKNILVDGQYSKNASVNINSENPEYIGDITIVGNNKAINKGNITLIIDKENSLGKNNTFLIKDGGKLDIKGTKLSLRLDENNNESGNIINSSNIKSELNILVDKNLKVNNLIDSNIKVVKSGNADLEFTNLNNNISELVIQDGSLTINSNTKLELVNNNGIININDVKLSLNRYNPSKNSMINLFLNNNENLLEIKDSDSNEKLNINITLGNNINKDKDLLIGNIVNEINLVNAENISNLYKYMLIKKENSVILSKIIKEKMINKLWFLNEINLISNNVSPSKFENGIYASFVNYIKKDNMKNSQDNNFYINKLSSNGIKLNLEIVNKLKNISLLSGIDITSMYTNVSTISNDKDIKSKFLINEILPKFGVKYGIFSLETRIGYINVYDLINSKNIHILKHNLDFSINPIFKISKDLEIEYMNTLGYVINPIINSNMEVEVKNSKPFYARYITGVKLKHKYIDAYFDIDLGINLSKITLKDLENTYTDTLRTKFNISLEGKPTNNMLITSKFGLNLNRKSYSNYIFNLGLGYKW